MLKVLISSENIDQFSSALSNAHFTPLHTHMTGSDLCVIYASSTDMTSRFVSKFEQVKDVGDVVIKLL